MLSESVKAVKAVSRAVLPKSKLMFGIVEAVMVVTLQGLLIVKMKVSVRVTAVNDASVTVSCI